MTLVRIPKPTDPTRAGQPRRWCAWIANPNHHRCPRYERTGEACWCRGSDPDVDKDWHWSVVPPLVFDPAAPAWTYDEDGPHPAPR